MKRLCVCTNAEQHIMSEHQGYKRLDEEDEHEGGGTPPKGVVEGRALKLYQTLLLGLAMLLIVRKEQNTRSSDLLRLFFRVPSMSPSSPPCLTYQRSITPALVR